MPMPKLERQAITLDSITCSSCKYWKDQTLFDDLPCKQHGVKGKELPCPEFVPNWSLIDDQTVATFNRVLGFLRNVKSRNLVLALMATNNRANELGFNIGDRLLYKFGSDWIRVTVCGASRKKLHLLSETGSLFHLSPTGLKRDDGQELPSVVKTTKVAVEIPKNQQLKKRKRQSIKIR